jgi:hypothetical protein
MRAGVLALMVAGSLIACSDDEPASVTVAKRFAAAVQGGDTEKMLELAESRAMQHLERAAERASDQVGGRRTIEPHEMLQVVDVDPSFQVAQAELVHEDAETATVRLVGADGRTHELSLVSEDGQWRVRISVPPVPAEEPS